MAAHSRMEVLTAMKSIGLVPVFYNGDAATACAIAAACVEGGARCIEFTNRGDRATDVFSRMAEFRDSDMPEMVLGVGSICDAHTAALYIAQGADFVVGPNIDDETARVCNLHKIPYSPGCGSVSEIQRAHALGVEICKVFPGTQVGGPGFLKAVRGPLPWAELMPTGGVAPTRANLEEWFSAGACCVGMGSKLIGKDIVAESAWDRLTNAVAKVIGLIDAIRT